MVQTAAMANRSNSSRFQLTNWLQPLVIGMFWSAALWCAALQTAQAYQYSNQELWQLIRQPGYFVMMRHARAPGFGDPSHFDLNDCSTQRNLSDDGRKQARQIGNAFRTQGIIEARIYSSQWCRCLDTANLLKLGAPTGIEQLNSFFRDFDQREKQMEGLRNWLAMQQLEQSTVLVTHQVNITAMTGFHPASGELVVVHRREDGEYIGIGKLSVDL